MKIKIQHIRNYQDAKQYLDGNFIALNAYVKNRKEGSKTFKNIFLYSFEVFYYFIILKKMKLNQWGQLKYKQKQMNLSVYQIGAIKK